VSKTIRAKMTAITKTIYNEARQGNITLQPVYSNDPTSENKKFWDATPSGKLELGGLKPETLASFELGKAYYIDITVAEE
jgi:hypothetical protein